MISVPGFDPLNISATHILYACLGSFVVFFTLFSLLIREKFYLGEAIWATVFGIIIGPYGANIVDPRSWASNDPVQFNTITLEITRVVLALGVFAIGVELPKSYIAVHWRSLTILLLTGMTWGWLVSAALIYALIPGLQFYSSLVIAACLTPTDPILAAAVCGGKYAEKHVPLHLRQILAAESALNDGLAFPFLFLSLYLVLDASTAQAIKDWVLITWLYQVVLGCVLGSVFGWTFRQLMKFCEKRDFIDRSSGVAQYVSLAIMTMGFAVLIGVDELLAAFFAGTVFSWDGAFNEQTEDSSFSSVIEMLFDSACFIFIGTWIPFGSFRNHILTLEVWRLAVLTILLLILRRLPPILISYKAIPDIKTLKEALFSGHFGPMGVGAVFISTLASTSLPLPTSSPENQQQLLASSIQPIVAFVVLWSILIHGLSIPFFTLTKRVNTLTRSWSINPSLQPEWLSQTRRADEALSTPIVASPKALGDIETGVTDTETGPQQEDAFTQAPLPPRTRLIRIVSRNEGDKKVEARQHRQEHAQRGGNWLTAGMKDEVGETTDPPKDAPADDAVTVEAAASPSMS